MANNSNSANRQSSLSNAELNRQAASLGLSREADLGISREADLGLKREVDLMMSRIVNSGRQSSGGRQNSGGRQSSGGGQNSGGRQNIGGQNSGRSLPEIKLEPASNGSSSESNSSGAIRLGVREVVTIRLGQGNATVREAGSLGQNGSGSNSGQRSNS